MNLIPWRRPREITGFVEPVAPATSIQRFRDEMDRMFDDLFNGRWGLTEPFSTTAREYLPALDIEDADDRIIVRAEVPGVAPENVNVTISGHLLTISGEKQETSEHRDGNCWHSERRFGSFKRRVELPADIDAQSVNAEHDNGVVTITVNRKATVRPKTVPVKATSRNGGKSRSLAPVG